MNIQIEVCIETIESARTAEQAGAHRLELNSAIGLGGLTPTWTLIEGVKTNSNLPLICMVRPRPGDFYYSPEEFEWMVSEAKSIISAGADGLAVGFQRANGEVDSERTAIFREICADRELVFHRAFDCTPNLHDAISQLVEVNVDRVLTSGGFSTADQGKDQIAQIQREFGEQIEILPGSGINHSNVCQILRETGCRQVHGTFRSVVSTGATFAPTLNFNECIGLRPTEKYEADHDEITKIRNAIRSLAN